MSRKSKSKKKGVVPRCSCGKRVRKRDKYCRGCARFTRKGLEAGLLKMAAEAAGPAAPAPAFIGKSAGAGRRGPAVAWCVRGHPNRPGGTYCSACQALMPGAGVQPLRLVKSSDGADALWRRRLADHPDPAMRELYYRALYDRNGGQAS